jgi:hypothetical protein
MTAYLFVDRYLITIHHVGLFSNRIDCFTDGCDRILSQEFVVSLEVFSRGLPFALDLVRWDEQGLVFALRHFFAAWDFWQSLPSCLIIRRNPLLGPEIFARARIELDLIAVIMHVLAGRCVASKICASEAFWQ